MYYSNRSSTKTASHTPRPFIPYTQSEIEALVAGYAEVTDDRAVNGRFFIKNNKKWIHNIEALRKKLNAEYGYYICDEQLSAPFPEGFGYDVEAYYQHNAKKPLSEYKDFRQLLENIRIH